MLSAVMVTDAVLGIVLLGHAAAFWAIPIVALQRAILPLPGDPMRGRIGVSLRELQPSTNQGRNEGTVIAEVAPGSPAEKAGLRKDDIVIMADDRPIRASQLRNKIGLARVGQDVKLTILRGGQTSSAVVKVAPPIQASSKSTRLLR
ncbi:PDZ domain-containing protein [Bradyrhizobium sp. PMVTL-01]|uniref:PDZ domain-containing protein n=1 Tax=Bradyrhizobium sp. PMVTL-01 TaxID=3434999 RepID=UPI003F7306AE